MKKTDFTIAVAIYNIEAYLEECMNSIIGQLDDSVELLLVDDGSCDGSSRICDRYAQQDQRITVIHQKNGGLSAARNTAIEHASGEWIVFVDGDDRMSDNAMAVMKEYVHDASQLIVFDYIKFDRNGQWNSCHLHSNSVLDTAEMLEQFRASTLYLQPALADIFTEGQCTTSWGKMWKLSYIKDNGYRFNTTVRRGEDNAFSFSASRNMSMIRVCNDCVYEYRQNRTGIMRRFEPRTPEHFSVLISVITNDMIAHDEQDVPLLRKGLCDLCMDGYSYCLVQTLAHRDCNWSGKERIAWLKTLLQMDWVKEAEEYKGTSIKKRLLLHLMKRKAYRTIDLCCRIFRLSDISKDCLKKRKS